MHKNKNERENAKLEKKGSLEKRLLSYTLVAGAFTMVPDLKAEIHYTNVDPDSICIDSLMLDVDSDGVAELNISYGSGSGGTNFIYADGVNKARVMDSASSSSFFALALDKGDSISAQKSFESYGILGKRNFYSATSSSSSYSSIRGNWPQNKEKYLGFSFEKVVEGGGIDTLYGWIRLKLDSTFTHFSAYAYAYEDISGKAIAAGDTGEVAADITLKNDLIPKEFNLHQNYPNPFNPSTKIAFELPKEEKIILNVYNMAGELITTLKNSVMPAGKYEIIWNGKNKNGQDAASGMYIYKLKAGNVILSKKMLLVR